MKFVHTKPPVTMHTMQAAAVILNMPFILVTFVALACALVSAIHDHDFVGAVFVAALAIVLLVVADVLILRNCIITPALRPASESNVDFIESPYSGDIDWNLRYLAICGIDTMNRGRMPTSCFSYSTAAPPSCRATSHGRRKTPFSRTASGDRSRELCIRRGQRRSTSRRRLSQTNASRRGGWSWTRANL